MFISRSSVILILILPMFGAQNLGETPIQFLIEWILKIEKFVDDSLVSIKALSKYYFKNEVPLDDQFINYARQKINSIWDGIESGLAAMKLVLNADGQLAIDCIISNRDNLKMIPFQLFTQVERCISGNLMEVANVTQYVCSELQRVQKDIRGATNQLKKCTGSIEHVFNCTVVVANNVSKVLQEIPTVVGNDWSILEINVEGLELAFESCSECDLENARRQSIKAFENISTCIVSGTRNRSDSGDDNNSHRSRAPLLERSVSLIVVLTLAIMIPT